MQPAPSYFVHIRHFLEMKILDCLNRSKVISLGIHALWRRLKATLTYLSSSGSLVATVPIEAGGQGPVR